MSLERHTRLKAIFARVVEIPVGDERAAVLDSLCGSDFELRAQVDELLRFDALQEQEPSSAILRGSLEKLWNNHSEIPESDHQEAPGRYEILRSLGEGGFGSVYLAREEEPISRLVAIKVIKPGMDTREVLKRFDSERRALASMDHPGIAKVFAAGSDEKGRPYFVMEYVDGVPITEYADAQQLNLRARLELFLEVCRAIQHAHWKGIVHRDIKPANILVTQVDGRPLPKVIDFGIAKALPDQSLDASALTREGQVIGTLFSMSPEQASGKSDGVDTRTDVYALGGLVYELLCGLPLFVLAPGQSNPTEFLRRLREEDPPRPSIRLSRDPRALELLKDRSLSSTREFERLVAADLDWIVMKALAKEPSRRYSSANELAADVQRYLSREAVLARPPSFSYQASRFVGRHRTGIALAAVVVLTLAGGTIGTSIGWSRSLEAEKTARENAEQARRAEEQARASADQAIREKETARAIEAFLQEDLLFAISPESQGFDVTMRSVVDLAATRIGKRFEGTPRVERAIRTTLGKAYRTLGLLVEAEEQINAALAIVPNSALEDPSAEFEEIAVARNEIGRIRLMEGRNEEAEGLFRSLATECAKILRDQNERTIEARHYLAVSLAEQDRFDEAEVIFDEVRTGSLAIFGANHELSIQALHSQGILRLSRARAKGASPDAQAGILLAEALEASRSLNGDDDARTVRRITDMAVFCQMTGDRKRALSLLQESYDRSRRIQGPNHVSTGLAAANLGMQRFQSGSFDTASENLIEGLRILEPLGDDHPLVVECRTQLAVCRMELAQFEEAEKLALAAYQAAKAAGDSRRLAGLLAEIYRRWGKAEESAAWRTRGK